MQVALLPGTSDSLGWGRLSLAAALLVFGIVLGIASVFWWVGRYWATPEGVRESDP